MTKSEFRVRDAVPGDGATLLSLIRALAHYERAPDAVEVSAETLDAQLAARVPPFECLLADAPGEGVLGFALTFRTYSTWKGRSGTWLEDFFVVPEARGRGLGRALLRAVAQRACGRGDGRLELTALDWNTPATDLYRRRGFQPLGDWTTWRISGDALEALAGGEA